MFLGRTNYSYLISSFATKMETELPTREKNLMPISKERNDFTVLYRKLDAR